MKAYEQNYFFERISQCKQIQITDPEIKTKGFGRVLSLKILRQCYLACITYHITVTKISNLRAHLKSWLLIKRKICTYAKHSWPTFFRKS